MHTLRHTVLEKEIDLERYYPPTPEKLSIANLDFSFYRGHPDIDLRNSGLNKLSSTIMRASGMLDDSRIEDIEAYSQIAQRADSIAHQ